MDLSRKAEVTDFHCNGGHSSVNADMMELGAKCPDTLEGGLWITLRDLWHRKGCFSSCVGVLEFPIHICLVGMD